MKVRIGGKEALTVEQIPKGEKDMMGFPNPFVWTRAQKILGETYWVRI
jgi:hypothetical protein